MNDGIMYTWDVMMSASHGSGLMHRCARKETAEYLRDWCEAEEYDRFIKASKLLLPTLGKERLERMCERLDSFYITESEVIL